MFSRATLAVQYATIIWHVRRFEKTRLPLGIMVASNSIAALVYLGLTFGFRDYDTDVYIGWYIVGAVEVLLAALLPLLGFASVLSFTGTHLLKRSTPPADRRRDPAQRPAPWAS